jgi:Do/DeqQ family serine protease
MNGRGGLHATSFLAALAIAGLAVTGCSKTEAGDSKDEPKASGQTQAKAEKEDEQQPIETELPTSTKTFDEEPPLRVAVSKAAEAASPAVVSLRVQARQRVRRGPIPFFGRGRPQDRIKRGQGSGVIIRDNGYILTNNHVVEEADRIEVELRDDRRFKGQVVGADPATDLAVVKIDAKDLPSASFAEPDSLKVGQWVVAIGSPFGLQYTVTSGVVSAKGRGGLGVNEIEDYIQTDASINPGNSGGPLVDLRGHVVGINTMIIGRGNNVGFAVPGELAQRVANQIIDSGHVSRAWIGVTFQDLDPEMAEQLGVESDDGALVSAVKPGGPADEGGMQSGDVIVAVDGKELSEGQDLLREIIKKDVGSKVELTILRDGERKTLAVKTGKRPGSGAPQKGPGGQQNGTAESYGLVLQKLTPSLAQRTPYRGKTGMLVARVMPGSPAQRAGLRKGDLIVEADGNEAKSAQVLTKALKDGSALLRVLREDGAFFTVLSK